MAPALALRDADHQLARVILPALAAEHGFQGLDRHLVAAGHHTPRRPRVIDEVEARAFVDEALAEFRSEEHTSELQSLMRSSYAVFCLKQTNIHISLTTT